MILIERVEDEYYVRIGHSMTKEHYISFVAAASSDDMQMRTLYPEGNAEARFKIRGVRRDILKLWRVNSFFPSSSSRDFNVFESVGCVT